MGSLASGERNDYFGKKLANERIFGMACCYICLDQNPNLTYEDLLAVGFSMSRDDEPGLAKVVDSIIDSQEFYMKEFGPASNPEYIKKYARMAKKIFQKNKRMMM